MKLALLLLLFLGGDEKAEFVPLRDGEILVGEITSHDEDGLELKRLDNGGFVRLRWGQLAPPAESALKTKLGYRFEAADEVLVEADELTLADGSRRVGRIRTADDKQISLQERSSYFTYLRSTLAGPPVKVRVAALDVYPRDEYYAEISGSYDLTSPQGNLELARLLERVPDFENSIRHFKEAQRLDPSFHPDEITKAVARLEEKKARQEELDALKEIEIRRAQKQWDRALVLCAEFPKRFPRSDAKTRQDVEKRIGAIEAAKKIDYTLKVANKYHEILGRLIARKAEDRKTPIGSAQAYVTGDMKKELVAAVAAALQRETNSKEFTEPFCAQLWSERSKDPRTRPNNRTTGYYSGTFVLGKEKAKDGLSNTVKSTGDDPVRSKEEAAMAEMQKKLQKLMARQQGGANASGGGKKPETAEGWYDKHSLFERGSFLTAWFVENGGEMEIVRKWGRPCDNCGGKGAIELQTTGADPNAGGVNVGGNRGGNQQQPSATGTVTVECPLCHGVQLVRMLSYR